MTNANPQLQLETLFLLDERQRIIATHEPHPSPGPALVIIRGESACAWAMRADVPDPSARDLERLASEEPPSADLNQPLRYADRYAELLGGGRIRCGPAFEFPQHLEEVDGDVSVVNDEAELHNHFSGWIAGEIAAGRAPVLAVRAPAPTAHPVSICFCARRSPAAAEAGIETAPPFRGRGYAPRATIAWANHVRALGLIPLYSTDWSNHPSLAVARKLNLVPFATDFSVET